jgi:hypothetical protein
MGQKLAKPIAILLIAAMLIALFSGQKEKWRINGESWTDPAAWFSGTKGVTAESYMRSQYGQREKPRRDAENQREAAE